MRLGEKLFRGSLVLGSCQVAGQICSLGRNAIIARMISPADYGVAAIFIMVTTFLDMISNLSLDRLLIQARDGDEPEFLYTGHLLMVGRGVIIGGLLLVMAWPLARLFSIPEATSCFYILALIPLLNGFSHLDPKRMERQLIFWPGASVEMVSQLLTLIVAWPAAKIFGDYRSVLFVLIIKSSCIFIGSHLVSRKPYRITYNSFYVKRYLYFGWPLLINGLLLFAVLQGDKFIMGAGKSIFGSEYSFDDIGIYSVSIMLTMVPAVMVKRITGSLFFPVFSKMSVSDEEEKEFYLIKSFGLLLSVIASCYIGFQIIAGYALLPVIFGKQYNASFLTYYFLSLLWGISLLRGLPVSVAMARGQTMIPLRANFIRVLSLLGVCIVVYNNWPLYLIAFFGLVGESGAYLYELILVEKHVIVSLGPVVRYFFMISLSIYCALCARNLFFENLNSVVMTVLFPMMLFCILCLLLYGRDIYLVLKFRS